MFREKGDSPEDKKAEYEFNNIYARSLRAPPPLQSCRVAWFHGSHMEGTVRRELRDPP